MGGLEVTGYDDGGRNLNLKGCGVERIWALGRAKTRPPVRGETSPEDHWQPVGRCI